MRGHAKSLVLPLAILALGAGCTKSAEGTGTLEVAAAAEPVVSDAPVMTDAQIESAARLNLAVKEVRVRIEPSAEVDAEVETPRVRDVEDDGAGDDEYGLWVTIDGARTISLSPGATEIAIGASEVPAGKITQIRLVLDGDAKLWQGGLWATVDCPSCTTSGLKLMLDEDVAVVADRTTTLKLVFDLSLSDLEVGEHLKLGPILHVEAAVDP